MIELVAWHVFGGGNTICPSRKHARRPGTDRTYCGLAIPDRRMLLPVLELDWCARCERGAA